MGTQSQTFGVNYVFGTGASDGPTITNFTPRTAEVKYEPEVNVDATNGEGHAESTAITRLDYRKITASITGYITAAFDPEATPLPFSWAPRPGGTARYFIIQNISVPRKKGEYVEVTIEAVSKKLITSANA